MGILVGDVAVLSGQFYQKVVGLFVTEFSHVHLLPCTIGKGLPETSTSATKSG